MMFNSRVVGQPLSSLLAVCLSYATTFMAILSNSIIFTGSSGMTHPLTNTTLNINRQESDEKFTRTGNTENILGANVIVKVSVTFIDLAQN